MDTNLLYPLIGHDYPVAVRAKGSYVYDSTGKCYFDGCSGAIVMNIGHGVDEVTAAIRAQLDDITYVTRLQFTNPWAEQLATELVALAPGELDHAFFTNSGSEAIEAAVRLALQYWQELGQPQRTVLVSRDASYHGATLAAIGLSGHPARRRPVRSMLPDWPRASAANCSFLPVRQDPVDLRAGLREFHRGRDPAGRPGPGGGGRHRAGGRRLRWCGAVACGLPAGRRADLPQTRRVARRRRGDHRSRPHRSLVRLRRGGRAARPAGARQGVSGGYAPLGAVLLTSRLYAAIRNGSGQFPLGHTYAANPLSTATGLAVLRYVREQNLPERARTLGPVLAGRLRELLDQRGIAADVRGRGLLLAVDFSQPGQPGPDGEVEAAGPPAGITAGAMVAAARQAGLLLYPAGVTSVPRVVVVAPPLTSTPAELDHLVDLFATALDSLTSPPRELTREKEGAVR